MRTALTEVASAARLWRIWLHLGVQDLRLRFRRSILGIWWIFLNLAVMILSIGFVYSNLFGQDLGTFIPYLTASLVVWGYLTNSIVEGGNAFVNSEGYIKQISLSIYVYVFRYFVSINLTTLISLAAFILVALIYRVPFNAGTLWVIPGIAILMATCLMLIMIFAHVNARLRDAAHLASMVMQVMFYVTPVIFPSELLRARGLDIVIDSNPLYHLLEVVRRPLLSSQPADPLNYAASGLILAGLGVLTLAIIRMHGRSIVYAL